MDKCKVMHCGRKNPMAMYTITQDGQASLLESTDQEIDLGVLLEKNLKPTLHCQHAASKASAALRRVRAAFLNLDVSSFKPLYTTYVRPHLEYCMQAIGPYMAQDLKALNKVQRRATKLVRGLRHIPYEERLKRLKLDTMSRRLLRGDLIEVFKIVYGKTKLDFNNFFELNMDKRVRGHNKKLKVKQVFHKARAMSFSRRVVKHCNLLPQEAGLEFHFL